ITLDQGLDIDYKPDGKRWTVKDTFTASIGENAQIVYDYDESGRLWHKYQPLDATSTATLTYQYFDDGAVKSVQSDFTYVTYAYDSRGRLWKVFSDGTDPATATFATPADATYQYDLIG